MSFTTLVNQAHSPQRALYELKQLLVAAGWTVEGSGDGTAGSFSPTADILTTYSTTTDAVPGAVTNRRAWWRLVAPDGRELLWQHAAWNDATDYVSVAYSRGAGFVGTDDGAIAADVAPTCTDSFMVMGEVRPSVTMNGDPISGGATITRCDYFIGNVDEGYSFALYMRDSAGDIQGGFFYDCLENTIDGDQDPYIVWSPGAVTTPFVVNGRLWSHYSTGWSYRDPGVGAVGTIVQSNFGPWGRPAIGAPREDAAQRHGILRPCYWQQYNVHNPGGANPYTTLVDIIEPAYFHTVSQAPVSGNPPWGTTTGPSTIGLVKGSSRFIKGISSAAGFSNRDTTAGLTRIGQAGGYWLLWDGATTPLA